MVVAVIIGFGCLVDQGVSSAVGEVLLVLNQGEHYIDEGDYTAGLELFRQADQQWKAVQGTWNPFVYNTDLEEVEAALAPPDQLYRNKQLQPCESGTQPYPHATEADSDPRAPHSKEHPLGRTIAPFELLNG